MSDRLQRSLPSDPPTAPLELGDRSALITLSGQTILAFVNGQCVERWNAPDMLGLLVQLGALAP